MERFTNNFQEVLNQLKKEFFDFKNINPEIEILTFLEYPKHPIHYGISFYIKNDKLKCLFRYWDSAYDNNRFKSGVFNIDRLAISEQMLEINDTFVQAFNKIDFDALNTIETEGISIGGWHVEINIVKLNKCLDWNFDQQMNPSLRELVQLIRNLVEPVIEIKEDSKYRF